MKTMKILILFLGVIMGTAFAGNYRAVFDLTSGDSKDWESLMNNLENVKKELKNVELKVVVHGGGLPLLLKETKFQEERMENLSRQGVLFIACENTMRRKNVTKENLHSFVKTVPAGVAEIIKDQQQGWAYIKIGH